MSEHRWSGWPGAWCLDCGCSDPREDALADGLSDDDGLVKIDPKLMECLETGSNMAKETKAYLCIGGPYDGRRYAADRMGFRAPKMVRQPPPISRFNAAIAPVSVEHVVYVADRVRCVSPDDEVWFWHPADQSVKETMEMLLEQYERANNIIWDENPLPR